MLRKRDRGRHASSGPGRVLETCFRCNGRCLHVVSHCLLSGKPEMEQFLTGIPALHAESFGSLAFSWLLCLSCLSHLALAVLLPEIPSDSSLLRCDLTEAGRQTPLWLIFGIRVSYINCGIYILDGSDCRDAHADWKSKLGYAFRSWYPIFSSPRIYSRKKLHCV